jgi:hypothetical protein
MVFTSALFVINWENWLGVKDLGFMKNIFSNPLPNLKTIAIIVERGTQTGRCPSG